MTYLPNDLAHELVAVLENYDESEGHTYAADVVSDGTGPACVRVDVTAPDGSVTSFRVDVSEIAS